MKKPDFVIAGEARCGTTSLFETLIQHPNILVPYATEDGFKYEGGEIQLAQKEPRFFDRNWDKGLNWYFGLFPNQPGTIVGDGSTMYLYYPDVMDRVKKTLPHTKIIIALRNPVDRFFSHFFHAHRVNKDFAEAYPTLDALMAEDIDLVTDTTMSQIYSRGIYCISVKHCLDLFDRSQVHIYKSEDMFANPKEELSKILKFLGVEDGPLDLRHVRQSGASEVDQKHRDRLVKFYTPYNQMLYELLGRDMGW